MPGRRRAPADRRDPDRHRRSRCRRAERGDGADGGQRQPPGAGSGCCRRHSRDWRRARRRRHGVHGRHRGRARSRRPRIAVDGRRGARHRRSTRARRDGVYRVSATASTARTRGRRPCSVWRSSTGKPATGVAFMRALESAVAETIKPLPINVDGAIAAVLHDLGYPAAAAKLIFIVGRTAGLAAHVMEEYTRERPMRIRIPVVYDGPPAVDAPVEEVSVVTAAATPVLRPVDHRGLVRHLRSRVRAAVLQHRVLLRLPARRPPAGRSRW